MQSILALTDSVSAVIFLFGGLYLKEAGVSENLLDQSPQGDMAVSRAGEEGEVSLNVILKIRQYKIYLVSSQVYLDTSAQVTLQTLSPCLPAP